MHWTQDSSLAFNFVRVLIDSNNVIFIISAVAHQNSVRGIAVANIFVDIYRLFIASRGATKPIIIPVEYPTT